MAPTKNSHSNCNNSAANYMPNSNNINGSNNFSGNQNVAGAGAATAQKKQTGTVPKATAPVQSMEHDAVAQHIRSSAIQNVVTAPTTVAASKSSKSTTKRSAAALMQQQKQQQLQQQPLAHSVFGTERASPFNVVTATQQHPQQHPTDPQQQPQQHAQHHQRKNTEIVAPIRRELKDLNDYLLSAVVTTTKSNQQQQHLHAPQQHQLKQHNYSKTQQQLQQVNESTSATSGSIDIESIPDSQSRFCYPVRPIQRRNLQQSDTINDYNSGNFSVANSTSTVGTTTSLNQLNHPAAVGVVIPTTPGILNNCNNNNNSYPLTALNDEITAETNHITTETTIRSNTCNNNSTINQQQLFLLQQLQQQIEEQSSLLVAASQQQQQHSTPTFLDLSASNLTTTAAPTFSSDIASNDVNFLQRLQLIQQILAISSKPSSVLVPGVQAVPLQQQHKTKNMVNENRSPTTTDQDIIVNSTSLEDVAISEMSDNRAQSIQSLHSAHEETPTPDNTPSYEELQQRLEASNRNIQNMQDQQQQLLRLQHQAKQHLTEMEALRNQATPLSFGQQNGGNSNDPPEYQSIEQVHSDMSALVGRMKNLTTFIQHQNDLGNLLGDDGPDILAEQEALQRKLESLRVQRDEMRSLVGELQDINRNAERTAEQRKQESAQQPRQEDNNLYAHINTAPVATSSATTQRVVPVEYSRIVPIELLQGATGELPEADTADDPAAAEMIRQKVADIAAMKAQLKRLKDMMETVNIIEEHTARKDPKDIGREAAATDAVIIPVQRQRERSISYDRERTPTAGGENNEFMSAKVRMLNEVTSDLRAQALNLQAERDRIKALKEEIVRRKAEAAAAAQLGEDALKRNSRTPTPQIQQRAEREQAERDVLKEEYEVKKKEFEQLCQRLQHNDGCNTSTPTTTLHRRANGAQEIVSEADDEADVEEELANDSEFGTTATVGSKYFSSSQTEQKHSATNATAATPQRSSKHSTEDSAAAAVVVANITQDTAASLEAASMQSGSSQSYSMPPPMHHLSGAPASSWLPGPIPPPLPTSWNPHFYYGGSSVPPSFTPPHFSTLHSGIGSMHQHNHQPAPSSADCICSASNSASTLGAAIATATGATSAASGGVAAPLTADPMLLQQFVQTQQMLINSVCQCNQMLWHQQREIDALNNTIHVLQDRLLALAGPSNADLAFNIRAESVPPPTSISSALHSNNIYASLQNRAQSEQPTAFLPLVRGGSTYAASNYHQQQQQQQQHLYQQQRQQRSAAGYNYATELQQQNTSSSASMYTALNNTAPPPPPQFNNEAPQSPMATAGPGPIFMHHHNNTIHQNNANLRTQNQHANNLQQQQQQQNNVAVNGNNTLNNQVPPGNRANNYWDNFRSYSRQNLLSTNSTKSNEDQNQQHVHQQIDPQYQPTVPHILPLPELPQEPQQLQQLFQQRLINQTSSNDCNNLNFDSNNSNNNNANCNKYLRSLQRSRINQLQQQQQQLVASNMLSTSTSNASNIYQANAPTASARELLESLTWHDNLAIGNDENIFSNYNISGNNDMPATYASNAASARNMNTNMNLNFGNNMLQYQRNKVPAKPTCRGATLQRGNAAQQQQYHNSIEPQRYDMLPATTTASASIPATTSSNPLNRSRERAQDFLLCTVDMASAYNYMPTAPVAEDFIAENNAVPINEDDDTTSEEIKRNLLVNALKNDKFTTKFYESIKEDVFRRLESLLLEKETASTERPLGSSSVQQHQQEQYVTQLVNEVSGAAARDPTRKLFLNAQMGNRQQQQQQRESQPISQQLKLEVAPTTTTITEYDSNNAEETESNNADENDLSSTSQPLLSIAESTAGDATAVCLEDEEPEENENQNHNMTTTATGARAATTAIQNIFSTNTQVTAITDNHTPVIAEQLRPLTGDQNSTSSKKRKNQRQPRNSDMPLGSSSGASQSEERQCIETPNINNNSRRASDTPTQHPNMPDVELINYIITRIHNQTHANTIINDTLLVEIAKLTATAAHNLTVAKLADIACGTSVGGSSNLAIIQQQHQPNISPKKIYAKIKKLSIPRQRDQFLIWYQGYLETLFVINNNISSNNSKHVASEKKLSARNNKQVQLQVTAECKLVNNNTSNKSQLKLQNDTAKTASKLNTNNNNILPNVDNLDINDADLAEADQICSANTSSNTSNTLPQHMDEDNDNDVDHDIDVVVNNYVANHTKNVAIAAAEINIEELENNENPEEEGAAACNNIQEKHDVEKEEKVKKSEKHSIEEMQTTAATTTDFFMPMAASLNASSNSDNTEDDSSNNTARAKAPKTEILKRGSVA